MKRLLPLLLCAIIMLPGCAHVSDNTAPAPTLTAAMAPTVTDALETPVPSPTPVPDLTGTVPYSPEERDMLKALWPLQTRTMADFGSLTQLGVLTTGGKCALTVRLQSDIPFDALVQSLPTFFVGGWTADSTTAAVYNSTAESITNVDCKLEDYGTQRVIDLKFYLDGSDDEIVALAQDHWPNDALTWPEELQAAEVISHVVFLSNTEHTVTRMWFLEDGADMLLWFDSRFAGTPGYLKGSDERGDFISFIAAGLRAMVLTDGTVFSMSFVEPFTETVSEGGFEAAPLLDDTVNIVGYTGPDGDVMLPASVNGMPLTGVSGGFSGRPILSVNIPEGVTFLGDNVFTDCTLLNVVVLPSTLKSIGNQAFANNTALQSISIPDGVHTIGEGAFSGCTSLESVIMP